MRLKSFPAVDLSRVKVSEMGEGDLSCKKGSVVNGGAFLLIIILDKKFVCFD